MNVMNKKPELLRRASGRPSLILGDFIGNLRDNDFHYENKQITQCVFLGVLRLKPVPSIFSNNVPSTSGTTGVGTKSSRRLKNRSANQSISYTNNVLEGRVSKKVSDNVKLAVKKVPAKMKLNTNDATSAEYPAPNSKQEAVTSDSLKSTSPDTIIARSTMLNPAMSPTTFNPVQNLFDKVKQKIDESHNEPGPSKSPIRSKEYLKSTPVKYNVCKINASEPDISTKKLLKPLLSSSPITVSDTESSDKVNQVYSEKDVIVISEDTDSVPPRNRMSLLKEHNRNRKRLTLLSHKRKSTNSVVSEGVPNLSFQDQEVIVINDDFNRNNCNISACDDAVIFIDEARASPELDNGEEASSSADEVILVMDKRLQDISKTQELNVSVEERQIESVGDGTVLTLETSDIKEEVDASEKPKRRKNSISPTHLPPMLLHAPMLLRSELASKKPSYTNIERPRVRRVKDKSTDASNSKQKTSSLRNMLLQQSAAMELEQSPRELQEVICLSDNSNGSSAVDKTASNIQEIDLVNEILTEQEVNDKQNQVTLAANLKDVITINEDEVDTKLIQESCKDDDILIVEEEIKPKLKTSPRLLRSDITRLRDLGNLDVDKLDLSNVEAALDLERIISCEMERLCRELNAPISITDELDPESPVPIQIHEPSEEIFMINDVEVPVPSPKPVQNTKQPVDLDEILIVSETPAKQPKQKPSKRLLRSGVADLEVEEKVSVKTEVVVEIHDEPRPKSGSPVLVRSEEVVVNEASHMPVSSESSQKFASTSMTTRSRKIKEERVSPVDVDEIQVIPDDGAVIRKVNSSGRLLRSNVTKKEVVPSYATRVLRSETAAQRCLLQTSHGKNSFQTSPRFDSCEVVDEIVVLDEKPGSVKEIKLKKGEKLLPASKKNPKNILSQSKKVVTTKKRRRRLNREVKSLLTKTPMLLRSELAQLRTVAVDVTPKKRKNNKEKAKPKKSDNRLLENATAQVETKRQRRGKRSAKSKVLADLEIVDSKPNIIHIQNTDNNNRKILALQNKEVNGAGVVSEVHGSSQVNKRVPGKRRKNSKNPGRTTESVVEATVENVSSKKAKFSKNPRRGNKAQKAAVPELNINSNLVGVQNVAEDGSTAAKKPRRSYKRRKVQSSSKEELKNEQKVAVTLAVVHGEVKEKVQRRRRPKGSNQLNGNTTEPFARQEETAKQVKQKPSPRRKRKATKTCEVQTIQDKVVSEPSLEESKQKPATSRKRKVKAIPMETDLGHLKPNEATLLFPEATPIHNLVKLKSPPKRRRKLKAATAEEVQIIEDKLTEDQSQQKPAPGKKRKVNTVQIVEVHRIIDELNQSEAVDASTPNYVKPARKRKPKTTKTEQVQIIETEDPLEVIQPQLPADKIPIKMDVFDFDETEPEVPPLRLTPRKDKAALPVQSACVAPPVPVEGTTNRGDAPSKQTAGKPSPLKQATITEMFKNMLKREKPASVTATTTTAIDSIFSQPKPVQSPLEPPATMKTQREEDEDSDTDSRTEWIPEEYAEYKFKYSAKKMMTAKPIHKCKICLLILPTYYKLSKHKEEHVKKEKPYECKQCSECFASIDDLTAHLRIHKGKHPYACRKCEIGFWSKKALDEHSVIHVLKKTKQPNKRFRCDVCAKEFSKLCDMERHTRVHTGEKPCICNICNKGFQQAHNLNKHLLTHLHVKPFHCEICNKQFGRNDVLDRHLLTHSVDKPVKCPLCAKGFIRQTQLNNHMKKNHPDAARIAEVST